MSLPFQIVLTWFQFLVYLKGITCNVIAYLESLSYVASALHLISIGFERSYFFFIGAAKFLINFNISNYTFLGNVLLMFLHRYYAICKPMVAQARCTWSRAKRIIIVLWTLSLALAVPIGYNQVGMKLC